MKIRVNQWPSLLSAYILNFEETPFEWGVNDCTTFAAGGVNVILGKDYYEDLGIGSYKTKDESIKIIKEKGFDSLIDLLDSLFPRTTKIRRGDLVAREFLKTEPVLGICYLPYDYFLGMDGLLTVKVDSPGKVIRWEV